MRDVSEKIKTYREAVAEGSIIVSPATIEAIKKGTTPKPDVLATARVAAIMAVKKTWEIIPLCHNISIEYAGVDFTMDNDRITVRVQVKSIGRTGCEMEAIHGVSVALITLYDMLKPIDSGMQIVDIHLVNKKGGKSDFVEDVGREVTAMVVVCSDSIAGGQKKDEAGKMICSMLQEAKVKVVDYEIIPDEPELIREKVQKGVNAGVDLIILTGGTGISPRDTTPDTIKEMLEREIPGIMEASRNYGLERTPHAMLSRGVSGVIGKSIVITLPGSRRGAKESMKAIFPYILHAIKAMDVFYKHEDKKTDNMRG